MEEVSSIYTNDLLKNIQNRYNKDLIFTNVGKSDVQHIIKYTQQYYILIMNIKI